VAKGLGGELPRWGNIQGAKRPTLGAKGAGGELANQQSGRSP